jgi:hypothetical protein
MTHEKILKLIDKAGFDIELPSVQDGTSLSYKLAKLAIESEREACAKVCDDLKITGLMLDAYSCNDAKHKCAEAIRARGGQA